jgi:flagellar hook-length control protein FliK
MPSIPLEIPIVASHVESTPPRSATNATSGDASSFGQHLQRAKAPTAETREADNSRAADKGEPATAAAQSTDTSQPVSPVTESEEAVSTEGQSESEKVLSTADKESTTESKSIDAGVDNQVVVANVALQLAQNVTAVAQPTTNQDEPVLVREIEDESKGSEKGNNKPSKEGKKVAGLKEPAPKVAAKKTEAAAKQTTSVALTDEKTITADDKLAATAMSPQDAVTLSSEETANEVAIASPAVELPTEKKNVEASASASNKVDKPTKGKSTTKVPSDSDESAQSPSDEIAPTEADKSEPRKTNASSEPTDPAPSPSNRPRANAILDPAGTTAVSSAAAVAASASTAAIADASNREANVKQQERTLSVRLKNDSVEGVKSPDVPQAAASTNQTTQPESTLNTRNSVPLVDLPSTSKLGTRSAGANTNLNEVDRVRFVQRVARAVMSAAERGGDIRLRLSPPELGAIKLDVVIRDGVMNARLETQTEAAKTILLDNLQSLRDRLAQQDIQIDQFEVDVQSGFSGSLPDRTPEQQEAATQRPAFVRPEKAGRNGERADSTPTPPIGYRVSRDGRLNVIV